MECESEKHLVNTDNQTISLSALAKVMIQVIEIWQGHNPKCHVVR